GDLVEVARVDADVICTTMDLDADPIELPLDRGAVEGLHRLVHAFGGGSEHREDRTKHLEADLSKALLTRATLYLRPLRETPREHQSPARDLCRDVRRFRDRVDHHAGERPLSQLAGEEPPDEIGFLLRGPAEQILENLLALCRRPASAGRLDLADRAIELSDRERRRGRRPMLNSVDRRAPKPAR